MSDYTRITRASQSVAVSPDDEGSTRKVLPPSRSGDPELVKPTVSGDALPIGRLHAPDVRLTVPSPAAQQPPNRGDGYVAEQYAALPAVNMISINFVKIKYY
jgi:hypothetical protein